MSKSEQEHIKTYREGKLVCNLESTYEYAEAILEKILEERDKKKASRDWSVKDVAQKWLNGR